MFSNFLISIITIFNEVNKGLAYIKRLNLQSTFYIIMIMNRPTLILLKYNSCNFEKKMAAKNNIDFFKVD